MKKLLLTLLISAWGFLLPLSSSASSIKTIETPYTIVNVRNGQIDGKAVIVAGSYDGVVALYDFEGNLIWENALSGYLNHDIYAADIDGDNKDEVLAASADGNIYCLDDDGKLLWSFKKNDAPMSSVCAIHKDGETYIACGGYDNYFYYLTKEGKEIDAIYSKSYSKSKPWGEDAPERFLHIINFLRPIKLSDGKEVLVVNGAMHSMSTPGYIYMFEPLAKMPYLTALPASNTTHGSISVVDSKNGESAKVLMGTTAMNNNAGVSEVDVESGKSVALPISAYRKGKIDGFGYRVAQSDMIKDSGEEKYMILYGRQMVLVSKNRSAVNSEVLSNRYSYNDMILDSSKEKIILASEQSGGSTIQIIDTKNSSWKKDFETHEPKGKIAQILENSTSLRESLDKFKAPKWEKGERPTVYFLSDKGKDKYSSKIIENIHKNYSSPIFLNTAWVGDTQDPATWSRDTMSNEFYKNRRDGRKKYKATADQILSQIKPYYDGDSKGFSTWGGHGNDPYYYSPEVTKEIYTYAKDGQKTVLLFPEFEGRGEDVEWLMNNFLYPLAKHAREYNGMIFVRSKNIFWLGNIYEKQWSRLISGEFSDVFIPSMEETSDKTMELSLAGRLGVWASGSTDSWGSRCARDNTSYNRLREHSHQMLPNHFLRNMVYQISYGAQYLDNFAVDQKYTSLLWEMIAKGLLYVPSRDQIVSFNPVHLSMLSPDVHFLDDGTEVKWLTRFDQKSEDENKMVFSRMDGSWPAAPTTEWDFSRYAAGAKERRLNFISSYNNGLVMITPPYDKEAPRGELESHLNPIYKGKMKEFFTDGRNYYSNAQKGETFAADSYYKVVEKAIKEGEKMMPLTVKGEVGWVAAQSAPKHIRLTIIDGGYINPSDKVATVKIGTAKVKSITDLVSGKKLEVKNGECKVDVACGLFRFLDVELYSELK